MDIAGVTIYSDLEDLLTKLLIEKIDKYLKEIIGNTEDYSKYIKSITLSKGIKNLSGTNIDECSHFMGDEGYDPSTKEITILVGDKIPLVYENIFHEIQHAKNSGADFSNLVLREKYPFIFDFIDEYIAYKKSINYMIRKELKGNEKILGWYLKVVGDRNIEYEDIINENIEYLNTINIREKYNDNYVKLNNNMYNNTYSFAYMLSKKRILGIEGYDTKFRRLIKELDKVSDRITNIDCRAIEKVFKAIIF
ncbi:hypothetical protein ACQPU1_08310 [Clostridium paraputrificum]|uniref:hypothetical protein n=1 Tax=Clostridium paraputrificum TaxID=29363 RepID=UPI003D358EA0